MWSPPRCGCQTSHMFTTPKMKRMIVFGFGFRFFLYLSLFPNTILFHLFRCLPLVRHLSFSKLYIVFQHFSSVNCDRRPPLAISWWTTSIRQLLHFFLRPRGRGEGVSIHHPVHLIIRGSLILLAQKSLEGIRRWANPGSSRQHPSRPRHRRARKSSSKVGASHSPGGEKKTIVRSPWSGRSFPWPVKGDLKEDRGNRKVETKSWF